MIASVFAVSAEAAIEDVVDGEGDACAGAAAEESAPVTALRSRVVEAGAEVSFFGSTFPNRFWYIGEEKKMITMVVRTTAYIRFLSMSAHG